MSPSLRKVWQPIARSSWLFFPFTSASVHDKEDAQQSTESTGHDSQRRAASSSTGSSSSSSSDVSSSDPDRSPLPNVELDTNAVIALAFLLGSATALGASTVYHRFFKRFRSAEWITPDFFGRKRWITGVVTSVGDADNFRLYHTPGFGWRGPLKFRHVPSIAKRGLTGKTIHIRIAGMDAPEGPHFGRLAQPHYNEAITWLKENIEGRRIKCELLRRDQYERVVALPLLPRTFWPWRHYRRWWTPQGGSGSGGATTITATTRNLPLEMIRAGWGIVYTQRGAVYGSDWEKETYLAAEAEAHSFSFAFFTNLGLWGFVVRAARRGMWQYGTNIESPTDYKKRYRVAEVGTKAEEEGEGEPTEDVERDKRVSFWGRIFGRRKRAGDSPS
ncbi:nuclease [Russula emetica]|nr:nuclease [Russula emetica]